MKQPIDGKKVHQVSPNSNNFDKSWRGTFEELGRKDLPAYRKASYETGKYAFCQREIFLEHLIRSLLPNMDSLEAKSPICLDLGCNIGRYTQIIHQHNFNACGMDYAASLVAEAKRIWPDIPFLVGNAYDIPFKDNAFDSAISFGLLQCVSDQRRVLREMLRVLRPGGIGLIETIQDFKFAFFEKIIRHIKYLTTREMRFGDLFGKLKDKLRPSASYAINYAPLKQSIGDIVGLLIELDAVEITVHNPTSFFFFHHLFWGVSFKKKSEESVSRRSKPVGYCPLCLRSGKWKR